MFDLSIVIVNYKTKNLVLDCVESIKKSKPNISWEVIIIDNGSKDGSSKLFNKIKSINVRVLVNKTNEGYAKANNRGIRTSKGKHVLLLNSDTLVEKDSIDELFAFAETSEGVGVVGSKLLNIDRSSQGSVMRFPTILGAVNEFWLGKAGYFGLYVPKTNKPTIVNAVVGAALLITQKARKQIGLLDERYFMYYEDLEYCKQVKKAGLKTYHLPSSEVIHYHGASGKDVVKPEVQWKRLVSSSKIYNGTIKHYIITFIIWTGQKCRRK